MLSVVNAYFGKVNRQPARDLRLLKSLPVSCVCIQEGEKIGSIVDSYFESHQDSGLITSNIGPARSVDISATKALIVTIGDVELVNINLYKDNFKSQEKSNLVLISRESSSELKSLFKSLGDRVVLCGNLQVLSAHSGLFNHRSPAKLFKSVKMNYVYNGDDFIAWRGLEDPSLEIIQSKDLGYDHDWMVAKF